jgi:hypothetical protein
MIIFFNTDLPNELSFTAIILDNEVIQLKGQPIRDNLHFFYNKIMQLFIT